MADTNIIKLGNADLNFKVGSSDCKIYLGEVLLYPEDVHPTPFSGKYKFTLTDDSVVSGECDSSSALTTTETSAYTSTLKEAVIGDCVTSIGHDAFQLCSSLSSITISDSVTSIGNSAFAYCSGLTSCTIGSGVTSIGRATFYYCSSLPSMTIPDSVTSIGTNTFDGCSSLTSVTIGNSVTSIESVAFQLCSSLSSITIPDSVTSIGNSAFAYCSGLTSVTVNAATPPTLGTNVFISTNDCPIYVPSASVNTYKAATNWSDYASRIQAIPSESCIDDSDGTWVTVDDNFNTEQAVYKLDFGGLYDAVLHGASYPSASINLFDENQNNIGMVDAFYDETNDLYNVTVYSGSVSTTFTVIYSEQEEEVDICSLFGKPLYFEYGVETPVYEYCVDSQCIQYCCNEWDEETGECIDYDYGCCEEEECIQNEFIYLSSAFVENNNS